MSGEKVLVLCATGKVGRNVCLALKEKGFDVYGTSRKKNASLESKGINVVVRNYAVKADLEKALAESGAKKVFVLTDFWTAAKGKRDLEISQGKMMIDACKEAGVESVVYSSVADAELMSEKAAHIRSKVPIEDYLKSSGIPNVTILRPVAFFENFDDSANYNPLVKGKVKFLSMASVKFCCTYDIGRAAAKVFASPVEYNQKTIDIASWQGTPHDVAAALQAISGVPSKGSLAMPICLRSLFLTDLHHMCLYLENEGGFKADISEFKKMVPEAFSAEDFFRFHNKYGNGQSIVSVNQK